MEQVHGTCIDVEGAGILLIGPSGSGKSDLALRLIDNHARLVSDDRVNIALNDGQLMASPPPEIAGKLEIRGIGIVHFEAMEEAPLKLVVDLVPKEEVDRMPEQTTTEFLGIPLPIIRLYPFNASCPAKIRTAVRILNGQMERSD